jgi:HK97 family phage portal protein
MTTWRDRVAGLIAGRNVADAVPVERVEPVLAHSDQVPLPEITRNSSSWTDFVETMGKLPAPTERTALTVSAIYASVNLIAGAIAALPINIYRVNIENGERDRIYDDDLHWVFNEQMTPRWTAASGWEFLCQSLLLHGDAFAVIERRGSGTPKGLTPVHPQRVTVAAYPDGSRLVYAVEPEVIGGNKDVRRVYDQDDILHVPGFGFDGLRGLSPLRHALRMTGASSIAMQDFSANFFANSARPDYALGTDNTLTKPQIDDLRKEIEEKHQGTQNSHRPMLLHGGLKFMPITMPIKDMELVAMRQFQIEEIARIYGVPPFMIGHNEKTTSWGSGVEAMAIGFVRFTLRQHLNKFQNEINRKLFRTAARVAEFDTADLERADTKSLFEALRIAVGRAGEPKIMSVNEARGHLRLKRTKDGDDMGINPGKSPAPQKEPAA